MATINTAEDILRALQDDPELLRQVRSLILTDDLLALPSQFAALLEEVAELRRTQNAMLETQSSMLETQSSMQETQNAMLETQNSLLEQIADLRRTQDAMLETQNSLLETQNQILRRLGNLETRFDRLDGDFGNFRANYAETAARKDAIGIAMALDDVHRWGIDELQVEALSPSQILALAGRYGSDNLAAIPRNLRRSFYLSDLIIKVPKTNGDVCYITAEASYTCDARDTGRAMAHANLLTRMTGEEAWPVIVGVRLDQRVESAVESGDVLWYPLDEQDMNP